MKIYDIPGFPNPARVRIALAEKGLDSAVQFVKVDLFDAEHHKSAFLKKNPSGVVPLLELDDGTLIGECAAITQYLDNLDGNPILTGKTALEKALITQATKRADDQLIDGVGVYFHHATPGLGERNKAYKNSGWALRKEWGVKHGEKALAGMKYFNDVLMTQPFVAGDAFSAADITVFCALIHADYAALPIAAELTALHEWRARIAERPSVKNRSGQDLLPEDLPKLAPLLAYHESLKAR